MAEFCIFLGSSLWTANAHAVTGPNVEWAKLKPTGSSTSATHAEYLKLENRQFFNSSKASYPHGAEGDHTSLFLSVDEGWNLGRGISTKVKISDQFSATENWNYLNIIEVYSQASSSRTRYSLGRKLELWSTADREWKQGLFQSRYLEDKLHPVEAGLVGVFVTSKINSLSFTAAFLPVHIPDFGPHSELKNNHFSSKNPWFHAPTDQILIGDTSTEVRYEIVQPDISDIILNPGVATKVEFENPGWLKGYLGRVAYSYKPIPPLLMGFPSDHQLSVGEYSDYMTVRIHPRVAYSRTLSWDNVLERGPWVTSTSVIYDQPLPHRGPEHFTAQQISSANVFSGAVARRLEDGGPRAVQVHAGFIKVHGGDAQASGRFGSERLFESRFQFLEAYSLGLKTEWRRWFKNPLELESQVIYDRLQGGGVFQIATAYQWNRNWRSHLQVTFMGLVVASAPVSDGFFAKYRANDSAALGVSYVF